MPQPQPFAHAACCAPPSTPDPRVCALCDLTAVRVDLVHYAKTHQKPTLLACAMSNETMSFEQHYIYPFGTD